MMQSAIV